MDGFMPDDYMLDKNECPDPRLGTEIRTVDLKVTPIHRSQENNTGKIPGFVLKGVFFALLMALLPLIQKQSPQLMHYANHSSITRSWDLIHLIFVGLAISYGLFARRPGAVAEDKDDDDLAVQGTQDYVQNMFDFASVFDDYNSGVDAVSTKNKAEAFSSMWRSEEPLHVIADHGNDNVAEKPLLLPIRSLKHSLSNSQMFDFLYEADNADVSSSNPAVAAAAQGETVKSEVRRNGEIFSVESGSFEEELSNIFDKDEPAVFRSPIPWSSRPDKINIKTPSHPAPVADKLRSDDGKIEDVFHSVFPSPIPWSYRLDPNTVPPAVESKPSDDGKQKMCGPNPQSSVLSDKQDRKSQAPPSRPPPPPPPPPPTVLERQSEKNFLTSSAQKAASSSPRSSPSPSVSPSPRSRPSPSPSPSPTPRQTPRPSPSPTRASSVRQANGNSQASPSPRQTPRPSPSPTRPHSVRQVNGNLQASSGIPLHKFSSPRPSPSPTRSRPVVMQNGSSEKQHNPIQRNNDEAGLTKKDDSVQRNVNELFPPSPPPPPTPTPAVADDPRPGKPEKKASVLSSPNSPACHTVAGNGSAHENRSSQRYDPNQSNGDVSRQNSSKDVQNSAFSDEIKPRRGPIHSPDPPPVPPSEDLSTPKKPLENGFTDRSESRSKIRVASSDRSESRSKIRVASSDRSESRSKIRVASSDRSESTSRSRGPTPHLSLSRRNSRDLEPDSSVSKQKTRDADFVPQVQSEKSSRKVPTPPVDADVPLPDSFPAPPPLPPFMVDKQSRNSTDLGYDWVGSQSESDTCKQENVDQKADEFIARFHEQIRLAKAQSYRERADNGQKLGMGNDLS